MEFFSNNLQLATALSSMVLGMIICFGYDLSRVARKAHAFSNITVTLWDMLIFAACAFATFCLLLTFCKGEIRFYALLFELTGFVTFRATVSRLIMAVSGAVIRFLRGVKRWMKKWIFRPIHQKLTFGGRAITSFTVKRAKKAGKICKKGLQKTGRVMYNKVHINKISGKRKAGDRHGNHEKKEKVEVRQYFT